jgi:broad specificity phosphatase PhoE
MKLLIVRHGECVANVEGVVAGSGNNSPLTAKGIADAQTAALTLKGRQVDLIVSSPLIRTLRTAEIIRDQIAPAQTIQPNADFIERNVGDATGIPVLEYFALEKQKQLIPNAETPAEFYQRVARGLNELKKYPGTVLLVTHGGTYRMITCVFQSLAPEEFANAPRLGNGEVKEWELTPEGAEAIGAMSINKPS